MKIASYFYFQNALLDVDSEKFCGRHLLRLPNVGMFWNRIYCPAYDQFSSAFYLKTDTTIEKISKTRAKMIQGDTSIIMIGLRRSGYMKAQKINKVLTSAFYATFQSLYLLNGSFSYNDTCSIMVLVFK